VYKSKKIKKSLTY